MGEKTLIEIYEWLPEWAKEKYQNCPVFHGVIMAAFRQGLNKEQTLWLLCETLCKDRDGWKKQTIDLIKAAPHPIMVKLEELKRSLK
jgi:hypothetical protein